MITFPINTNQTDFSTYQLTDQLLCLLIYCQRSVALPRDLLADLPSDLPTKFSSFFIVTLTDLHVVLASDPPTDLPNDLITDSAIPLPVDAFRSARPFFSAYWSSQVTRAIGTRDTSARSIGSQHQSGSVSGYFHTLVTGSTGNNSNNKVINSFI